jgi:general stress protein 26
MPEPLKKSEIEKGQDPSVTKQWDDDVPLDKKMEDFGKIADGLGFCMMGTLRNDVGPVGRAMAVAKRSGPDFLFLANAHSQKFDDIEKNKVTNVYFHNSTTQDWISVTGDSVTSSNDDSRIKQVWTEGTKAWFGDLGDGTHTGGPEDPRMKLIEVHAKCED